MARLCHYFGSYFCHGCHHKDTAIIPARVVHNWDFNPYPVSSEAHELLQIMSNRPLIHISSMNPKLYTYIQGLREIEVRRGGGKEGVCVNGVCACVCGGGGDGRSSLPMEGGRLRRVAVCARKEEGEGK